MSLGSHNQPHWRGVVTNTGNVAGAGLSSKDLAEQQVGIFPVKPTGGDPKSVATANFAIHPFIKIGYGNAKFEGQEQKGTFADLSNWSTQVIYGKNIKSWKGVKAKRLPEGGTRGEIWTMGYDGVDASLSLKAALSWNQVIVRVHFFGTPIAKAFGQNRIMREYILDKGCIPESCTDANVSADYLANNFLEQYNKDQYYKKYFKDFAKAYKTKITNPATSAPSVACNRYEVTVPCDEGDGAALGRIQSQYVGYKVERVAKAGMSSTYSMWRTVAQGAPSAISLADVVVTNCADACPSGFTKTAKANVYQIVVNAGVTVPAVTGETSRTKNSAQPERDTYVIYTATTTALATVQADVTAGNPIITFSGVAQSICTQTTPTTYAWAVAQTAVKGSKQWKITLADANCLGTYTDKLTALQLAYPYLVVAVATNGAAACATTFTTTTYSDCSTLDCGETGIFDVKAPDPYERHTVWEEYKEPVAAPDCSEPTPVDPECAAVGIRFESNSWRRDTNELSYGYFPYDPSDQEAVKLLITVHSHDYTTSLCDVSTDFHVKKIQSVSFEGGTGSMVREKEKWFKHYEMRDWDFDPNNREIFGMVAIAKAHKYYDEYQLTVNHSTTGEFISSNSSNNYQITYSFFVEEGKGKAFETAMNAYIASVGSPELSPVIL